MSPPSPLYHTQSRVRTLSLHRPATLSFFIFFARRNPSRITFVSVVAPPCADKPSDVRVRKVQSNGRLRDVLCHGRFRMAWRWMLKADKRVAAYRCSDEE